MTACAATVARFRWTALFGAAALLAPPAVPASADDRTCLSWEEPVTLEGFVLDGVFPGPPEFESVEDGDARIEALLLYLAEPVCISGSGQADAEDIDATELVQLACSAAASLPRGAIVNLKGTLFPAHTGYHRTPALLDCEG